MRESAPKQRGFTPLEPRRLVNGKNVNDRLAEITGNGGIPPERRGAGADDAPRSPFYFVKVTGDGGYAAGVYACSYWMAQAQAVFDPSKPLTDANLTPPTAEISTGGVFVHLREKNGSGHKLTDLGTTFDSNVTLAQIRNYTSDGKPVFFGEMFRFINCTPP